MNPVIDVSVASRSERGQRSGNEDKVLVGRDGSRTLAIVADGAGGHVGGAEASARAVEALEASLQDPRTLFSADALSRAIQSAHTGICAASARRPGARSVDRMHTTVVVLWVDSVRQRALWAHVGDSRLYRVRAGAVELLTRDDSIVQRLVDAGLISDSQAETHPQKNQLIAALGIDDDVDPHTVEPTPLRDGDAYLLCSDGWWGAVRDGDIVDTLADAASPEEWLALMQARVEAVAAPRQDNFSAVGLWVGDPTEVTQPMMPTDFAS